MISGAQSQIFKLNLSAQEAKFPVWVTANDVVGFMKFSYALPNDCTCFPTWQQIGFKALSRDPYQDFILFF